MQFTIVWSNKCNLTCDYCCVYDSLNKGSVLSLEDAYSFFKWQLSLYPSEEPHIIEFFGGEPTLHMEEINSLIVHMDTVYPSYNISYRIYTNCIFNKRIKQMNHIWSRFSDIICSIDGVYEDNLLRTKNQKSYDLSIDNFKYLLNFKTAGIAFVLHPNSDFKKTFNYFKNMGCRYFHFEIASLWNDDKDNNITLQYLYKIFYDIYELVLLNNINSDSYYLFSIPREFLSSDNFFINKDRHSCLDTMRSLSPEGNVYFCRDLAVSEFHLKPKSTEKSDVFFKSNDIIPFNIKNLQLDLESNTYNIKAREYDNLTSCPVKSFEFIHLARVNPEWITNKNFQDLIIYPLFEIMNDTFLLYNQNKIKDKQYLSFYKQRIISYKKVLDKYADIFPEYKRIS